MITEASVKKFGRLISGLTGLRIREEDTEKLRTILMERMKCLEVASPEAYFPFLGFETDKGLTEWEALLPLILNGETYFFRDKGQWALLEETILPELIQRRTAQRSIRIWSAGCSTGEEAYSLAMAVDQLLPFPRNWKVYILGTDINRRAIEHAKQGSYRQWAFRMVKSDLQNKYFLDRKKSWVLKDHIRSMVTFHPGNLFKDDFSAPMSGIYDMDLILCRNVFLYFEPDAIAQVMKKMTGVLTRGGCLMTGHNELPSEALGQLQIRNFRTGVMYQLPEKPQPPGVSVTPGLLKQSSVS